MTRGFWLNLGHAGIHRSVSVDVVAIIYQFMGEDSVIGLSSILTLHTDFVQYVAVIASIGD
jgi:hypothetical protein